MLSSTRRSVLKKLLIVVGILAVLSTLSSAQRPVGPVTHPAPTPMRVYTPPIYHAPVVRPPAMYAPILTAPRSAFIPSAGRAIVLPPVRPIRPIRPFPPVIFVYSPLFVFGGFWPSNVCWWSSCDLYWPSPLNTFFFTPPAPANYVAQVYETPVYVYGYGSEREDLPELDLKDGTILNVTDYWVVDDQLHFKIIEQAGMKPVEHTIPFEQLDLQKTIDANTRRGFRFVLRDQPFEESVRDHPDGPPPLAAPPHQ